MIFSSVLLPGAVASDDSQRLAARNLERDVLHCFEIVKAGLMPEKLGKQLAQSIRTLLDDAEALRDVLQPNYG